jgi:hypothetical protein
MKIQEISCSNILNLNVPVTVEKFRLTVDPFDSIHPHRIRYPDNTKTVGIKTEKLRVLLNRPVIQSKRLDDFFDKSTVKTIIFETHPTMLDCMEFLSKFPYVTRVTFGTLPVGGIKQFCQRIEGSLIKRLTIDYLGYFSEFHVGNMFIDFDLIAKFKRVKIRELQPSFGHIPNGTPMRHYSKRIYKTQNIKKVSFGFCVTPKYLLKSFKYVDFESVKFGKFKISVHSIDEYKLILKRIFYNIPEEQMVIIPIQ